MKKPNCTGLILVILLTCAVSEETECPSVIEYNAECGVIGIEDPSTEFLLIYDRKI